jgi:uncharacterized membrane protein YhfC
MHIAIRLLNAILMIALPLALAPIFVRRLGVAWRLFGVGALTFFGSQVLHIPFNLWALNPLLQQLHSNDIHPTLALVASALLLGLSAGLFEEVSRYLVLRFWLREERTWGQMLMFGLGHGGFEAILLGVWAVYVFFQAFALHQVDLTAFVPADQVQSITSSLTFYWEAPWHTALLGAVERALAICLHLGLTSLVWQAVVRRSIGWMGLAIAWHTIANAGALIIYQTGSIYWAEGFLALAAGISLILVRALRRHGPAVESLAAPTSPRPPLLVERVSAAEDLGTNKLDESRYLE